MYEEAKAAAEKYKGTVKELDEAQASFEKRLRDAKTYFDEKDAKKESDKTASKTESKQKNLISKTQERLDSISAMDKNRWSVQFDQLQQSVESANAEFRNTNDVESYTKKVNEAFKAFDRFAKLPAGKEVDQTFGSIDEARSYFENTLGGYKQIIRGVSGSTGLDTKGVAEWSAVVMDARGKVLQLGATWNSEANKMVLTSKALPDQLTGFGGMIDNLKRKTKELFVYWTANLFNPYRMIGYVKQIVGVVRQYDDALTEMRKVSEETMSSLKNFQTQSFSQANQIGTTALQLQQSTADWLRLGESFQEAQKSAQTSNILLNVSEFSSIDDATKALTSASQAYKEFEKIEIVDKLNNIGNNFSVSTDQLAQGLQNAAAVLKTQGNDLDQSLALLTAGNAITQDMSKTSAGIRTIALRISGTEEAKNEIADIGEDVDDFVVRTKSKTDQIIRDYTAVASNAYKGISVLDENGNLRDTYEILLDIAQIYKEIQAEDKKNGSNRAQALTETLAGKNRSNIVASILQNPELLENVYEKSQESAGSALVENEKYLDSISGKLQILTNNMQELVYVTIDSEGFKVLLDIVNALISGVGTLAKQFGSLNVLIGGAAGILMQKSGAGKQMSWLICHRCAA